MSELRIDPEIMIPPISDVSKRYCAVVVASITMVMVVDAAIFPDVAVKHLLSDLACFFNKRWPSTIIDVIFVVEWFTWRLLFSQPKH